MSSRISKVQNPFNLMHEHFSFLLTDFSHNGIPFRNTGLLLLLVLFVLVLVAIVGEMDHKFILAFDILLIVFLNGET